MRERTFFSELYQSFIIHTNTINQELSSFRSSCVVFVHREANFVAHNLLAKKVISCRLNAIWLEDILSFIQSVVLRDQSVPRS
jgi:hypothetical protein